MDSQNTKTNHLTLLVTEKTQPSNQTHLYVDILSLPNSIKTHLNPKNQSHIQKEEERYPSVPDIIRESKSLFSLAFPIAITALIFYARSIISMLFLGRLGDLELAAGSLAIAFANITGYSVLSGLALGMEPLCSQAFGAKKPKLLSLTLHRTVIFLLFCSLPISILWVNMSKILLCLGQDPSITGLAQIYLFCSLPELLTNSVLHPIRIYLRAQGITYPLTLASLAGTALHLPVNLYLVSHLNLGLAGVAVGAAVSNFFAVVSLVCYIWIRGIHKPTWTKPSRECFTDWKPLVKLAVPSCVSVCLEWWWYEIMIVLCGLLVNPKATVASMGILIQTTSLIYVFPSSLSFAVSTRVGNELGANRPRRAKLSATLAVVAAAVIGVTASTFASAMKDRWGMMFTGDSEILRLTAAALPILGLCEIGNCPQTVACGVVRGSARPSTAANVNLGAFYLVGMPVALGSAFWVGYGFCGLWLGLLSAQVCCAGLMLYVVGSTDWNFESKRAQMLTCAAENVDNEVTTPSCGGGAGGAITAGDASDDNNIKEAEPLISVTVSSE